MKLIIVLLLIVAIILFFKKFQGGAEETLSNLKKKTILNDFEKKLFIQLKTALPDHQILTKVSFQNLMSADSQDKDVSNQSVWRSFSTRVADFVIADSEFNVKAIVQIENTYKGKQSAKKQKNLDVLEEVGYKVVTVKYGSKLSDVELKGLIQ